MNILVTGASGFIGKHVVKKLSGEHTIFSYDKDNTKEDLINFVKQSNFIIHLAGINRPLTVDEFYDGNSNLTKSLVDIVKEYNPSISVLISSSIQAALDNDYGKSKKLAEDYLFNSGLNVYVFRLANVFGKWCKPNYNSAAATFCYNIAKNLPIEIRDPNYIVNYNYVDDIVDTFKKCVLNDIKPSKDILYVQPTYECSLGHLADLLSYFKQEIESDRHLPLIHSEFELKLFKTFCDYLSDDGYTFNFASDDRGSFEELYKSKKYGQISENISYPNITKGGHYHTYKQEIFYTVIGNCEIIQKNVQTNEIKKDCVYGDKPNPIEIKTNCVHTIKNIGTNNSHTVMWISEIYNENTSDTYKEN